MLGLTRCYRIPSFPSRFHTLSSINRTQTRRQFFSARFKANPRTATSGGAFNADEPLLSEELQRTSTVRPILFVLGVSVGSFILAAKYTSQDTEKWKQKLSTRWIPGLNMLTSRDLMAARIGELQQKLQNGLFRIRNATAGFPAAISRNITRFYVIVCNSWLATPEGRRTCLAITALNGVVFLAWQIPRLRGVMLRNWLHHPLSGRSYTMLTSTFSHQGFTHLLFNSVALITFGSSFGEASRQRLEDPNLLQSTSRYEFLSFYVSAGLFAALLSHLVSVRFKLPQVIARLSRGSTAVSTSAINAISPSLGASGAIYAIMTLSALAIPETSVALIFFPLYPIPINVGVSALVCLDILGIIRGWRMFDHWAHLGGATFGVMYYFFAPWEAARRKFGTSPRSTSSNLSA